MMRCMSVKDYVEFQDGVIERITLAPDRIDIEFSHLAIYKEEAPNTFGVWAAKAVLSAAGIRSLAIIGAVAREHDRVSEGGVSRSGDTLVDVDVLQSVPDGTIELLFSQSAARLHCRASTVSLVIRDAGKRFESYTDE